MSHYHYYKYRRGGRVYEAEQVDDDGTQWRCEKKIVEKARPKIMGVCAGIAWQMGWDVTLVRIAALLSLFVFTLPTFFLYIIAGAVFY